LLTEQPIRDPLTGGQPRYPLPTNRLFVRRGLRVLFVGRWATGQALATILANREMHVVKALDGRALDGVVQDSEAELLSFELVTLTNQKIALQEIHLYPPKVVLVEVEDKPDSRVRFCEMLRYRLPAALIFAVGVRHPQSTFAFDRVLQLPLQAEDVLAALQSVQEDESNDVLQRGPIHLNVITRTVTSVNGQRHMTPKQCALLQFLMLRANQVVSRSEIMENVWETNYLEDTRTLDVHIRWLRECIEPDPSTPVYLLTERGKGYHLSIPPSA
jgi:DNA-binding response OmpR family regulator